MDRHSAPSWLRRGEEGRWRWLRQFGHDPRSFCISYYDLFPTLIYLFWQKTRMFWAAAPSKRLVLNNKCIFKRKRWGGWEQRDCHVIHDLIVVRNTPKLGGFNVPSTELGRDYMFYSGVKLYNKFSKVGDWVLEFCRLHVWKRTQYESAQQTTINQQRTLPNKLLTTVSITNTDSITFQCCNWRKLLSCRDAPNWPDIGIAVTAYRWIGQNSATPVSKCFGNLHSPSYY